MNELLANLGGSWRQVLIYPGGVALWAVLLLSQRMWAAPAVEQPRSRIAGGWWQLASVWLLCALLPWPRTYWAYPLDGFSALVLLEAPFWLRLRVQRHDPEPARQQAAQDRMAAVLCVYPLLALALGLFAQSSGSLLLPTLQAQTVWLRWVGVGLWAVALPPLLDLGPWRHNDRLDYPLLARRVGHVALLTVLALPARDTFGYGIAALALGLSLGSLVALDKLWRGAPRYWERWQPTLALLALGLLSWTAIQDLLARMR